MNTDAYLEQHEDFMIDLAAKLCAVESIAGEPAGENAPYGAGCRKALDEALSLCRALGFETCDVGGYAGHAEIGQGEEIIAIMTHLDTVPAGGGWTSDPFTLVERNGMLVARGISDDKGPCAATMCAMRAIKELNIPLKRRVRLIMGCDEENGMPDLVHYFEKTEAPLWGFTPDAMFPVINCEKHIFQSTLHKSVSDMGRVVSLRAGERFNVVCEEAVLKLNAPLTGAEKDAIAQYAKDCPATIETADMSVTVRGVAAHASRPQLGVNAAAYMLDLICRAQLLTGEAAEGVAYLNSRIACQTDGASLGIACQDKESGPLTSNLGMVRLENGVLSASFDMRCPVTVSKDELISRMRKAADEGGFELDIVIFLDGILVPADSELVRTLLDVYREGTGLEAEPISIGGGTYARDLPNRAVAFGPGFPGKPELAHQRDEGIGREDLLCVAKLIAKAIVRLAGE